MSEFACYLTGEALVHLRGAKVAAFLQGQVSCDTRLLTTEQAITGAYCNVKGRVISDLTILLIDVDHCVLRLRASMADSVANTLQRYAQFSRISVEADPRSQAILGCYEPAAVSNMPAAGHQKPAAAPDKAAPSNSYRLTPLRVVGEGSVLSLQRDPGRVEHILIEEGARKALQSQYEAREEGQENVWRCGSLRQGHYAIEQPDSEVFTPQALNYDLTGLLAFDKGCYTGQEVVARLHYKGKSKKRLGIFTLPPGTESVPRDAQLTDSLGKTCGRVLDCQTDYDGARVIAAEVLSDHRGLALSLAGGADLAPLLY